MSRLVAFNLFKAAKRSLTDVPSGSATDIGPESSIFIVLRGTTSVFTPSAVSRTNIGCDTIFSVVMAIFKSPCVIFTFDKLIVPPVTIVPVLSLITSFALTSGETKIFSISVKNLTIFFFLASGTLISIRLASIACEILDLNFELRLSTTRFAVVKSGSIRTYSILPVSDNNSVGTERSTVAPDGIVADVV